MRLSGRDIAEKVYETLKKRVGELQQKNITPHLVVILIGANPASVAYVKQKRTKGEEIGCKVTIINYEETITTDELEEKVKELNDDLLVHGILIQRPVPQHVDIDKLELLTNPKKDIDGFHPDSPYTFPIPLAVTKILEEVYFLSHPEPRHSEFISESHGILKQVQDDKSVQHDNFIDWIKNKNIIILGKGPTGGGPIITYFKKHDIPVQIIDSKTTNREELLKNADIIISAVGRENIINPEDIKHGVILIGVGILRGADGKLHGDYNEEAIDSIAGYYTPTPGGVGPVNVSMLFENVLTAAEKQTQ